MMNQPMKKTAMIEMNTMIQIKKKTNTIKMKILWVNIILNIDKYEHDAKNINVDQNLVEEDVDYEEN
jgi:hypothetical protein